MLSRIMVGTLATFNWLVSPFGPSTDNKATYVYQLESTAQVRSQCQIKGHSQISEWQLKADQLKGEFLRLNGKINVCTDSGNFRQMLWNLYLPLEILDKEFIEKLPEGVGYVFPQGPHPYDSEQKAHVKVTKLGPAATRQMRMQVEWIPDGSTLPTPLTITFDTETGVWKRLQWNIKNPGFGNEFSLNGVLVNGPKKL